MRVVEIEKNPLGRGTRETIRGLRFDSPLPALVPVLGSALAERHIVCSNIRVETVLAEIPQSSCCGMPVVNFEREK